MDSHDRLMSGHENFCSVMPWGNVCLAAERKNGGILVTAWQCPGGFFDVHCTSVRKFIEWLMLERCQTKHEITDSFIRAFYIQ